MIGNLRSGPWIAPSLALAALVLLPGPAGAQTATLEKVQAALPKIEAYAQKLVDAGEIPGLAISIVFDDQVVYLGGFGVREMGKAATVDADTVFQIASSSKPVASTIVASLVSDGTVAWDTRIADIDPDFQLFDAYPTEQVTLRDLFSHRSGLPGNAGNDIEQLGYDRDTILHRLRLVPPASSFRSTYAYSNFGLTEGGVAAAKAAGMTWEDAAEAKLYRPLGMSDTSSRYADFLARPNRATLHSPYEGTWQPLVQRMPDAQSPAGGVSSSARDMAKWMRLELGNGTYDGKRLIKPEAIAETHKPVMSLGDDPVTGAPGFYGLGWVIQYGRHGLMWGHAGAFSVGARSLVNLLPKERLGIVVLGNAFPTGAPEAVADTFFDLVFDGEASTDWLKPWNAEFASLFGPGLKASQATFGTPPAAPSAPLPLSAYAGTYSNDYVGDAVVATEDGGLVVKLGPGGKSVFPLTHFNRDLFIYHPMREAPEMSFAVTFEIGPDGKATEVTLDGLNDEGFGTLKRAEP